MKISCVKNGLVVGVILLFVGVAVQPSIAIVQPEEEINTDTKKYLFQTLIDISNHPDVKKFLEQSENDRKNNNDFVSFDIDKSVYRKIFFRNPRLFSSLIFTKPSMTYDYLDFIYNQGIKIIEILGEEKILEILDSVDVNNPEFFEKLNSIITKDPELYNKIIKLEEMNHEYVSAFTWKFPIICTILLLIYATLFIRIIIFMNIFITISYYPYLSVLFYPLYLIFGGIMDIRSVFLYYFFWLLRCPIFS